MLLTVSTQPEEMNASKAAFANVSVAAAAASSMAAEPITLEQAKAHLRVVGFDDDAYISALITAARQMAEGKLNRTLVQRQIVATFSSWQERMRLLKPPIISVDAIEYLDTDGALQPFAEFDSIDGLVQVAYGTAVPALRYRADAVRVTYTAGYAEGEVPQPIIQWMLLAIGAMYEHRESMTAGAKVEMLPEEFNRWLLQPYMVYE